MIAGLDSSLVAPSAAQAQAAGAAGVPLWSGYLTTHSGVGILASWTQDAFDKARLAGCRPIGFCSGWDNPEGIRQLAALYDVLPCLDVEDGIRSDGPWVADWLRRSGAGLYGNFSVHYHTGEPVGRGAAFNVGAAYPGFDPRATWPSYLPRPPHACGWQWVGTHVEFGVPVDRGWYDDWFLPFGPGRGGDITGGFLMGSTMGGFRLGDVDHCFELSTDGDVLWGRTGGGAGGHVHVGFWNMGGSGPGPVVDLAAWPSGTDIVIRTKYADGLVMELVVHADEPDQDAVVALPWYRPETYGPFAVPAARGPKGDVGADGPPGKDGAPGATAAEIADELGRRIANG